MQNCPPNYDCQAFASCPSKLLPCPNGFFCSSYQNNSYQGELDLQYALIKMMYGNNGVEITDSNKEKYIDKDRAIQTQCLAGFYCPDTTTMLVSYHNSMLSLYSKERFLPIALPLWSLVSIRHSAAS